MAKVYFTKTAVVGVFRIKQLKSGQQGKRLRLCNIKEYNTYIDDEGNERPRSKASKLRLIDKLYNEKLRELLVEERKELKNASKVSNLMNEWLEYVKVKNSPTTEGVYRVTVNYYLESVGDHDVEDYSNKKYVTFLNHLKTKKNKSGGPLSEQRIRSHFRQLRTFYNWCFKFRHLSRAFYIELPGADKKDPVPYRQDDLKKLLDAILKEISGAKRRNHRISRQNDLRLLIIAPYLGFRRGAVWSLELDDIDLKTGLITIKNKIVHVNKDIDVTWKNKGRKEVKHPIPEILKGYLSADLESRNKKERYYLDKGNGYPCYKTPAGITKAFRRLKQKAGIPKEVKPVHAFRASCVNGLISMNVNPSVIKDYFDHESFVTSDGYSEEDLRRMKNAADQIEIGWEDALFPNFAASNDTDNDTQ